MSDADSNPVLFAKLDEVILLLRELLAAQRQAATRRRLLRLKDAAQYCSLSPKKLRRLIASQAIPAIRNGDGSGGIVLVDLEDLNRWISRMKE